MGCPGQTGYTPVTLCVGIINVNHFGKQALIVGLSHEAHSPKINYVVIRNVISTCIMFPGNWQFFQAKEVLDACSAQNNVGGVEVLTTLTADTRVCILGPVCG